MKVRSRGSVGWSLLVTALAFQSAVFADPGFGTFRKRKIELQVRRPAVVRLANTSIAFKGVAANREYAAILPSLEATLEAELVSNERTLVKKPITEAEWILQLTVTGLSVPAPVRRVQQVPKGQPVVYNRWMGSLNIAYQVTTRDGRVHDADNVSSSYDREFQADAAPPVRIPGLPGPKANEVIPRTQDEVKQILIGEVVNRVSGNLGNTMQPIEVQVAAGEDNLNRAADFLDKRLWARAIDQLEKMPAYVKTEDESYRQYNLGLSYEAASYDAKTFQEQRASLFKAQELYDKAAELNRGQKYFLESIARTRDSVARYRTLDAMDKSDKGRLAQKDGAKPVSTTGQGTQPTPPGDSKTLVVADVIEMFTAGVPEDQTVELIRTSPGAYDFGKDTLIAITRAKLPVSLQNEMRKKMGLAPLAAPKPAPPKPKPTTPPQ